MIKFLTTQGLNYHLDELLKNAKEKIILIAPYILLHKRIKEVLAEKRSKNIPITIVCRKKDLKEPLDNYSSSIIDIPSLHAKCYITENGAIVSSLNLHEFSQLNNDEMGFFIKNESDSKHIYEEIYNESTRLCFNLAINNHANFKNIYLKIGRKYSGTELDDIFNFEFKGRSGIKKSENGDIVLFSNSTFHPYSDLEQGNTFLFQGQNTGTNEQKLIYGNKDLHDCFGSASKRIYLFKDYTFCGEFFIKDKPYKNAGNWYFPLAKK